MTSVAEQITERLSLDGMGEHMPEEVRRALPRAGHVAERDLRRRRRRGQVALGGALLALGRCRRRRVVGRIVRRKAAGRAETAKRGLAAGATATVAMSAYQTAVLKVRGEESSSTPAQAVNKILKVITGRELPESWMGPLNNIAHFTYGTSWGVAFAFAYDARPDGVVERGVEAGLAVWGASLVELPALGLSPPVWKWPPAQTALDVSYHLVYGVTLAGAYRAFLRAGR